MTVPSEWVLNQLLGKIASGFGGKGESLKVITVTPFDLSKLTTPSNCLKKKKGYFKFVWRFQIENP